MDLSADQIEVLVMNGAPDHYAHLQEDGIVIVYCRGAWPVWFIDRGGNVRQGCLPGEGDGQ